MASVTMASVSAPVIAPRGASRQAQREFKLRASARSSSSPSASRRQQTVCFGNTALTIAGSTGLLLFLGRFAVLPYQRQWLQRQGLPKQNGQTHAQAGDSRAEENTFKTGDPAGFTIVDVLAWGALGHALGFATLALQSFSVVGQ
eukprot:jgi/Chlat1/6183/Chrsp42S05737